MPGAPPIPTQRPIVIPGGKGSSCKLLFYPSARTTRPRSSGFCRLPQWRRFSSSTLLDAALPGDILPRAPLPGDSGTIAPLPGDAPPNATLPGDILPPAALSGSFRTPTALSGGFRTFLGPKTSIYRPTTNRVSKYRPKSPGASGFRPAAPERPARLRRSAQLGSARQRRGAQPAIVRHSVRHSAKLTFAGIRPLQQKSRYIIPVFVLCNADSVIGCFSSMSGYLSGHFTYNAPLNEKTHKRSV